MSPLSHIKGCFFERERGRETAGRMKWNSVQAAAASR